MTPASLTTPSSDRPRCVTVVRIPLREIVIDGEGLEQLVKVLQAGLGPQLTATREPVLTLPAGVIAIEVQIGPPIPSATCSISSIEASSAPPVAVQGRCPLSKFPLTSYSW